MSPLPPASLIDSRASSSLAMRRRATRTNGRTDGQTDRPVGGRTDGRRGDEWLYEWTVRVDRESDESFPRVSAERSRRGCGTLFGPSGYSEKVSGRFMTATIAIKWSPLSKDAGNGLLHSRARLSLLSSITCVSSAKEIGIERAREERRERHARIFLFFFFEITPAASVIISNLHSRRKESFLFISPRRT